MTSYQTQSRITILGTVPATITGTVPVVPYGGTVTATILGTVPVTQPLLGTVALVATIGTILSPITAQITPVKRGTVTSQVIATLTPTTVSTLLVSNPNRAEFYIRLLDPGTVYIGFAGTVSSATFTVLLLDYEMFSDDVYTGVVTGRSEGSNVRVVAWEA